MFTKQHHKSIASIVKATLLNYKWSSDDVRIQEFLYNLANYFQYDNPKFNEDKFLEACGFNGSERNDEKT